MPYPLATDDDVAHFQEHGWLAVPDAIDPADLATLEGTLPGHPRSQGDDGLRLGVGAGSGPRRARVQDPPVEPDDVLARSSTDAPFRTWAVGSPRRSSGCRLEFWYDQFLAKPPQKSVATRWHQDEGYWGRNLDERGITCWMPFHDVDPSNGCMHFIDGGHRDGVLEHRTRRRRAERPARRARPTSRGPWPARSALGGVTFHHSKTPHMTTANTTDSWRRILTQHLQAVGVEGEGDHYPWKVYVNQVTGERTVPDTR